MSLLELYFLFHCKDTTPLVSNRLGAFCDWDEDRENVPTFPIKKEQLVATNITSTTPISICSSTGAIDRVLPAMLPLTPRNARNKPLCHPLVELPLLVAASTNTPRSNAYRFDVRSPS